MIPPSRTTVDVRGTAVDLLSAGNGAPLLFLHGAGGAGRWLPFQAAVSREFAVSFPSHPGHGGSPPAEWIEHISDLAFHYLDLLDALGIDRVHLVGASFGGWIAAEIATMASPRLRSLTLIDPVGIKVEGWIYPFLFAMELDELVATVFQDPLAALALAPEGQDLDTIVGLYRQQTAIARVAWNPYLYNPLLRRRLARIDAPTLVCWGEHDRVAPVAPCASAWVDAIPGAELRVFAKCGHVPHLEDPDDVAAVVTAFCRAHADRR